MKREILFRGKRVDNGEWVEGFYARIQRDDSSYLYVIKLDTTLHISNVTRTTFEVIPESVGQFTGTIVKDRKLFEGDLFKRKGNIYQIVYDEHYCSFMLRCNKLCKKYYFDHFSVWSFDYIGNIHDNPELLS